MKVCIFIPFSSLYLVGFVSFNKLKFIIGHFSSLISLKFVSLCHLIGCVWWVLCFFSKLKFIISSSITEACNNSVLLLGPRGCGKAAVSLQFHTCFNFIVFLIMFLLVWVFVFVWAMGEGVGACSWWFAKRVSRYDHNGMCTTCHYRPCQIQWCLLTWKFGTS